MSRSCSSFKSSLALFTLYLLLWYNNIIEIIAETEGVLAFFVLVAIEYLVGIF
ncbi:Uncharacterised protein [Streptococcus pneumoniae]|nr:Uncharacterised protein [Streptococcus pneumoniae]